ncbi:ribonuclease H-like domain-containing protein, partial [Tanacetum coccineum]
FCPRDLSTGSSISNALPYNVKRICPQVIEIVEPPKEGYQLTLKLDFSKIPRKKGISSVQAVILSSQLKEILSDVKTQEISQETYKPIKLVYHLNEPFYVVKQPAKLTAIFPIRFKEESDVVIAKTFFQELVNVGSSGVCAKAPPCYWSPNPPPELRGEPLSDLSTNGGFVAFDIYSHHVEGKKLDKTALQHTNTAEDHRIEKVKAGPSATPAGPNTNPVGPSILVFTIIPNDDSTRIKLEHGYWGVFSSSREHRITRPADFFSAVIVPALQCDHGGEYDNTRFHNLFRQNGMQFRFSCPKTSQQNGKSERMLRTLNNITRTLLFQAHIPPSYWVEALNMAAHLLNILPSTAINNEIPFTKLHNKPPTYDHLRVFGCLCYPHISFDHKLQPRSTACVFLGYPALHRGYRCLDLSTNKIIISRHVIFDEDQFPFGSMTPDTPPSYDFLLPPHNTHTSQTTHPNNHQLHPPTAMPPSPTHTSPTQSPQAQPQSPHHPLTPRTPATHQQIPVPPLSSTHEPTTPSSTPNTHITSPAATAYGNAPTTNTHHMVTRAKAGISKPLARMNCHATTTSPIPRSHLHALRDPNWHKAMVDEYNALISNGTWALVPRPANVNIVRSMWLFKHKFNADGSLSRYKARLVANGRSQQQGIDFDETFSPVVKPATIRTVLSLAVTRDWPIHQLDVKNAFLHGQLSETVYMHQPPGFVDSAHPDYVCHLQRSLYGLKQAPRAWFQRFASFITRVGFQHSKTDTSLFVYHMGSDVAYLLLYVDDIILTASSTALLQRIITLLHSEFAMTDLGSLNYFLGVSAQRSKSGLFLSQSKFAEEILERAHMQHCNPCKTPVDTESKLGSDGDPVSDPTLYRSLAGALQYLTFTRPDISYVVQQICLYMHDPRDPYFTALKRILRYVRGTIDHGLQLYVSSTSQLTAYTDADWAGCPVTRRSTSGYCVFLSDNLLSWSVKRHVTLSHFSAEAEYRGVANVVAETVWIRNLLLELHTPLSTATLVYYDNVSSVYLSTNPVQHQRTKHIEIDIHFVREYVASSQVHVLHVPSRFQYADIFTKGLPTALFLEFRSSLNMSKLENLTKGKTKGVTIPLVSLAEKEENRTVEEMLEIFNHESEKRDAASNMLIDELDNILEVEDEDKEVADQCAFEATDHTMGEAIEMRSLNDKTYMEKKFEEYKVQVKKMDALSKLVRDGFYDFRMLEDEYKKVDEILKEILLEEARIEKQKEELDKDERKSWLNWLRKMYQAV